MLNMMNTKTANEKSGIRCLISSTLSLRLVPHCLYNRLVMPQWAEPLIMLQWTEAYSSLFVCIVFVRNAYLGILLQLSVEICNIGIII